eukprot:1905912-Amphidinium_carterae.1
MGATKVAKPHLTQRSELNYSAPRALASMSWCIGYSSCNQLEGADATTNKMFDKRLCNFGYLFHKNLS